MFSVYALARMHVCTGLLCIPCLHTTFKLSLTASWIQPMDDVLCMVIDDSFALCNFWSI